MATLSGTRVWVTGAEGFVGAHLLPRLRAAGADVSASDRDLDVADLALVDDAVRRLRPDAIVHLAGRSSVAASHADAHGVFAVNYLGTRALLASAARHAPRARVLLAGTGQVYGSARAGAPPFREDAPLRPASPYAWSKAAADLLGADYASRGLAVIRARAFNHTGAGQSELFAAGSFARQLAEIEAGLREPVLRVGNLDSVRDFLDVDDVVDAYVCLLDPDVAPGCYNVASGRGRPMREVLDVLVSHARVRPRIEVDARLLRPAEASVGDAARLTAATGWKPKRSLDDCLARLLAAWREQLAPGAPA
jgi:GDP-4-dehydro-6-deoxy-D-mannose reductase